MNLDDIEQEFQRGLVKITAGDLSGREQLSKALFALSRKFTERTSQRGSGNRLGDRDYRMIEKGIAAAATLFADLNAGARNELAELPSNPGRPRASSFERKRRLWIATVAGLELDIGSRIGRSSSATFRVTAQKLNDGARATKAAFQHVTALEVKSHWNNRHRFTDTDLSLISKLREAVGGSPERARKAPYEAAYELAIVSIISKTPLL